MNFPLKIEESRERDSLDTRERERERKGAEESISRLFRAAPGVHARCK